jgi:hypothetical protein
MILSQRTENACSRSAAAEASMPDDVIERRQACFRAFAHRDDNLFVWDSRNVTSGENAGDIRRVMRIDFNFAARRELKRSF